MKTKVFYLSETNRKKQNEMLLNENNSTTSNLANQINYLYGAVELNFNDPVLISNVLKFFNMRKELTTQYKKSSNNISEETKEELFQQIDHCNEVLRNLLLL